MAANGLVADRGWGVDFEAYVAARGQSLLRFARALCGDQASAEDLVQAGLADALAHWERVVAADQPDAYMRQVMLNRFLSWRRSRAAGELVVDMTRVLAHRASGDDTAREVTDRDDVRRSLAELPPRSRAVLVLRYFDGLSDTEIADALGVSAGTVRSTASRALAVLRERSTMARLAEEAT
jgi:RNA polymerase sigma-70 factor (sigma-E family)